MQNLIEFGSVTEEISEFLNELVRARYNIVISGGTGSGKTTFLNALSEYIQSDSRIITVEDSAELKIDHIDNLISLESRPPNIENKGEITIRDLVKTALRMRPDRIIVGEVRGDETIDMLQAMNTGHEGSLTTIHANSSRDALMRLESMVAMSKLEISNEFTRRFIASALDIIIQISRFPDGTRKLLSIQEITGMEGNIITLQEIFSFRQTGVAEDEKVQGHFKFHGVRPRFLDKFTVAGISVPREMFDPDRIFEI